MKKLLLAIYVLSIAGCATVIDGGPDAINMMTSDGSRVTAEVTTRMGTQTVILPGVVIVPKSCSGVKITVLEEGRTKQSYAVVHSGVNPWIFGSIVFGGVIGIGLGVAASYTLSAFSPLPAVLAWWSIVLAFGVSAAVGVFFGVMPARRAGKLDPVVALRTE